MFKLMFAERTLIKAGVLGFGKERALTFRFDSRKDARAALKDLQKAGRFASGRCRVAVA